MREDLQQFVKRAEYIIAPQIQEWRDEEHIRKWGSQNPQNLKDAQKKYFLTEKGRNAIKKGQENRRTRFIKACEGLSEEEKTQIQEFYANCHAGLHVDHIIPISKGGLHRLVNLQYLKPTENLKKASKIYVHNYVREMFKSSTIVHDSM